MIARHLARYAGEPHACSRLRREAGPDEGATTPSIHGHSTFIRGKDRTLSGGAACCGGDRRVSPRRRRPRRGLVAAAPVTGAGHPRDDRDDARRWRRPGSRFGRGTVSGTTARPASPACSRVSPASVIPAAANAAGAVERGVERAVVAVRREPLLAACLYRAARLVAVGIGPARNAVRSRNEDASSRSSRGSWRLHPHRAPCECMRDFNIRQCGRRPDPADKGKVSGRGLLRWGSAPPGTPSGAGMRTHRPGRRGGGRPRSDGVVAPSSAPSAVRMHAGF
jgi:hypothetical protein